MGWPSEEGDFSSTQDKSGLRKWHQARCVTLGLTDSNWCVGGDWFFLHSCFDSILCTAIVYHEWNRVTVSKCSCLVFVFHGNLPSCYLALQKNIDCSLNSIAVRWFLLLLMQKMGLFSTSLCETTCLVMRRVWCVSHEVKIMHETQ